MEAGTIAPPESGQNGTPASEPDEEQLEGEEGAQTHDEVVISLGDGQLSLAVGGKRPTDSKCVIRGGQIPLEGQLQKGDAVTLRLELRCAEVHLVDKIDSTTREVVQTTRKHVLKVEGAERLTD